MTKQQDTLRMCAKVFLAISHGGTISRKDAKIVADLCCLALPMKYRFTRDELDGIKTRVESQL